MTGTVVIHRVVLRAVLWVQPDGGQRRARRNAWASMVADTQRRAQCLEVERSLAAANAGVAGSSSVRHTATA